MARKTSEPKPKGNRNGLESYGERDAQQRARKHQARARQNPRSRTAQSRSGATETGAPQRDGERTGPCGAAAGSESSEPRSDFKSLSGAVGGSRSRSAALGAARRPIAQRTAQKRSAGANGAENAQQGPKAVKRWLLAP